MKFEKKFIEIQAGWFETKYQTKSIIDLNVKKMTGYYGGTKPWSGN